MRSIFVNYRRNDSEGEAGRLFDDLELNFGQGSVFMDVAGIEPGHDFRKAIDQSVAACSVLLAVIGERWLDSADAMGRRRLDDPNDFVRVELSTALRAEVRVVPVLVRGAKMPQADELPDNLKELAYRNAVELTHARWKSDVQVLVRALRPFLDEPDAAVPATPIAEGDKATERVAEVSAEPPAAPKVDIAAVGGVIDAKTVERLSRALALYIGPISGVVVKRAARQCVSEEELCAMIAREIPADADRARFLRSCKS
jgi:hypothetical protein